MKYLLKPKVFTDAAKRIASGMNAFTCSAVEKAINISKIKDPNGLFPKEYSSNYTYYFKDTESVLYHDAVWFGPWTGPDAEENQLARSLALLFMAEIAKDLNLEHVKQRKG